MKNIDELFEQFKVCYSIFGEQTMNSNLPQPMTIRTDDMFIHSRKMAVTNYFCIANVDIEDQLRGKGFFKRIIDFITKNPYSFNGIEIEAVHNKDLVLFLSKNGFHLKEETYLGAPTLIKDFL